jgi:ABC-2 type transport system ATP-binding protein
MNSDLKEKNITAESDSATVSSLDESAIDCQDELKDTKEYVPMLTCKGLCKKYGSTVALNNFSIEIPEGEIVGLLGPNGSGKTTFLKIVAGLLKANAGSVDVAGEQIGVGSKSVVAYLPERNSIPEHFTVNDALDYYTDFFYDFDRVRAELMLKSLGVKCGSKIKSLSKGTKEKVQLVMVMARRAKLYLLDEPISGVDPAARDFIINTIINNFHDFVNRISQKCVNSVTKINRLLPARHREGYRVAFAELYKTPSAPPR